MKLFIIIFTFLGWLSLPEGHPDSDQQKNMTDAVNKIRSQGCYCGRKYMAPVDQIA